MTRIVAIILGILFIAYQYSNYLAALAARPRDGSAYVGWVNFWYYTSDVTINLIMAFLVVFSAVGLILIPIYPPKSNIGILLGYLGTVIFSYGFALTRNLSPWRGYVPDTALIGYAIALVGTIVAGIGYRFN